MSYAQQINLRDRNKEAFIELAILSFKLRIAFLNTQNSTLATLPLNSANKFSDTPTNFLTHNSTQKTDNSACLVVEGWF
ncbi:hypothetical protein C7B69_00130 [filamentous cyanobacterium Phorm 46]|nr:hypothetical protein C7B69_00130 [filamentous cyanobacterium Phorm 46]PSB53670.1 hypothetical protein C7B67_02150 [filamentous cyanobacterium Phorm 6]